MSNQHILPSTFCPFRMCSIILSPSNTFESHWKLTNHEHSVWILSQGPQVQVWSTVDLTGQTELVIHMALCQMSLVTLPPNNAHRQWANQTSHPWFLSSLVGGSSSFSKLCLKRRFLSRFSLTRRRFSCFLSIASLLFCSTSPSSPFRNTSRRNLRISRALFLFCSRERVWWHCIDDG